MPWRRSRAARTGSARAPGAGRDVELRDAVRDAGAEGLLGERADVLLHEVETGACEAYDAAFGMVLTLGKPPGRGVVPHEEQPLEHPPPAHEARTRQRTAKRTRFVHAGVRAFAAENIENPLRRHLPGPADFASPVALRRASPGHVPPSPTASGRLRTTAPAGISGSLRPVLCRVARRLLIVSVLLAASSSAGLPTLAYAQGGEVVDAGLADASSGSSSRAPPAVSAPSGLPAPPPAPAASEESAPRPARGPSVRERGGRRSRGASTASGALMLFILVGFMGWYVVKRLRR